jgi:hypothetical protein
MYVLNPTKNRYRQRFAPTTAQCLSRTPLSGAKRRLTTQLTCLARLSELRSSKNQSGGAGQVQCLVRPAFIITPDRWVPAR